MHYLITTVAFSAIFGTVFGAEVPCCVSKQFHAKLKILSGTLTNGSTSPIISETLLMIDHDRDHRMEFIQANVTENDETSQKIYSYFAINDYRHERRYNFNSTWCDWEHINNEEMSNGCVPRIAALRQHSLSTQSNIRGGKESKAGLKWSGTSVFGSADSSVHANVWVGTIDGLRWTVATSIEDCTPISYTRFGEENDGTRVTENVLYTDFVQGSLTGTHVFDIPSHCPKPPTPGAIGK